MMENRTMQAEAYKQTELGELPKDWSVVRLNNEEMFNFENGLWAGTKEPLKKVFVLRNTNFEDNGKLSFDDVTELNVEEKKFLKKKLENGDIIIERSGGGPKQPVGRVAYFSKGGDYSFSNFTSRLRINNQQKCFSKYLLYYLVHFYNNGNTKSMQNATTGIRNLDFNKYKEILVPLPPLQEQQKIAYVLSTIQEAQEKTYNYINALKELKKSVMKHLFTYGVVPFDEKDKVELKETEIGMIPKSWEVKKLGDITNTYSGGTPNRGKKSYWESGTISWAKSGELGDKRIKKVEEKITQEGFENSSAKFVEIGDLLIAMYGATAGKVGLAEEKFTINQAVCGIKPNEKFNSTFYFYYLILIRNKLLSQRFGGAQPNINQQIIKSLQLPNPSLPEQQRIASILSVIDSKIEAEESKKKALDELFKSMLKELMTAKIRVKDLEVDD